MTRFVIDARTLVHLVTEGAEVAPSHQLVAPQALRSQALDLLYAAIRRGALSERAALRHHETMTGIRIRLLGDRVSRRVSWQLAGELGLDSIAAAEYLAVTRPQAGLFVSVDPAARALAGASSRWARSGS
jgi:hypothetical protein